MPACRRDQADPLLQKLYENWKLHLLTPRTGVDVGGLFILKTDGEVWPADLLDLFDGTLPPLVKHADEEVGDFAQTFSAKLEAGGVVDFLKGVAEYFGAHGGGGIDAAYTSARTMQLRALDVTVDTADLPKIAGFLRRATMLEDQGVYGPGDRIFLMREVVRAREVQVMAFDAAGAKLKIDAKATNFAKAGARLQVRSEGAYSQVYRGDRPAAFAVKLVEIEGEPPGWKISGLSEAIVLRGEDGDDSAATSIIGDAKVGPLFLDVTSRAA
jgi:hypothetical protein